MFDKINTKVVALVVVVVLFFCCYCDQSANNGSVPNEKIFIKRMDVSRQDSELIYNSCDSLSVLFSIIKQGGIKKICIYNYFYDTLLIPLYYTGCNPGFFIGKPDKVDYMLCKNDSLIMVSSEINFLGKCDKYEKVLKNDYCCIFINTLPNESTANVMRFFLSATADSSGSKIDVDIPIIINIGSTCH